MRGRGVNSLTISLKPDNQIGLRVPSPFYQHRTRSRSNSAKKPFPKMLIAKDTIGEQGGGEYGGGEQPSFEEYPQIQNRGKEDDKLHDGESGNSKELLLRMQALKKLLQEDQLTQLNEVQEQNQKQLHGKDAKCGAYSITNSGILQSTTHPQRNISLVEMQNDKSKEIDLSGQRLQIFPEQISKMVWLESLILDRNQFSRLPQSIGDLHHLRKLSMSDNFFFSIPSSFSKLCNLTELNISANRLDTFPEEICELKQLRKLYVDRNDFVSLPLSINKLCNLELFRIDWFAYALPPLDQIQTVENINLLRNHCTQLLLHSPTKKKHSRDLSFFEFIDIFSEQQTLFSHQYEKGRNIFHLSALAQHFGVLKAAASSQQHQYLINQLDNDTQTPFSLALLHNQLIAAKILLFFSADPLIGGGKYGSCLKIALTKLDEDIVRQILEKGGNPNDMDFEGNSCLHHLFGVFKRNPAKASVIAKILIENGANCNARNYDDLTPLHQAVKGEEMEVVNWAVSSQNFIDNFEWDSQMTKSKFSLLHQCAKFYCSNIMNSLLDRVNPLLLSSNMKTARNMAQNASYNQKVLRKEEIFHFTKHFREIDNREQKETLLNTAYLRSNQHTFPVEKYQQLIKEKLANRKIEGNDKNMLQSTIYREYNQPRSRCHSNGRQSTPSQERYQIYSGKYPYTPIYSDYQNLISGKQSHCQSGAIEALTIELNSFCETIISDIISCDGNEVFLPDVRRSTISETLAIFKTNQDPPLDSFEVILDTEEAKEGVLLPSPIGNLLTASEKFYRAALREAVALLTNEKVSLSSKCAILSKLQNQYVLTEADNDTFREYLPSLLQSVVTFIVQRNGDIILTSKICEFLSSISNSRTIQFLSALALSPQIRTSKGPNIFLQTHLFFFLSQAQRLPPSVYILKSADSSQANQPIRKSTHQQNKQFEPIVDTSKAKPQLDQSIIFKPLFQMHMKRLTSNSTSDNISTAQQLSTPSTLITPICHSYQFQDKIELNSYKNANNYPHQQKIAMLTDSNSPKNHSFPNQNTWDNQQASKICFQNKPPQTSAIYTSQISQQNPSYQMITQSNQNASQPSTKTAPALTYLQSSIRHTEIKLKENTMAPQPHPSQQAYINLLHQIPPHNQENLQKQPNKPLQKQEHNNNAPLYIYTPQRSPALQHVKQKEQTQMQISPQPSKSPQIQISPQPQPSHPISRSPHIQISPQPSHPISRSPNLKHPPDFTSQKYPVISYTDNKPKRYPEERNHKRAISVFNNAQVSPRSLNNPTGCNPQPTHPLVIHPQKDLSHSAFTPQRTPSPLQKNSLIYPSKTLLKKAPISVNPPKMTLYNNSQKSPSSHETSKIPHFSITHFSFSSKNPLPCATNKNDSSIRQKQLSSCVNHPSPLKVSCKTLGTPQNRQLMRVNTTNSTTCSSSQYFRDNPDRLISYPNLANQKIQRHPTPNDR